MRLRRDAAALIDAVRLGDYVRVAGEKQHEHLFDGTDLEIDP